jgi:phosphatidylglycerophosphate synthase
MLNAKQIADTITASRLLLGVALIYLGLTQGAAGIAAATILLLINWTGDSLDGAIARRSRPFYHSWIGDNDLLVDMVVSGCVLVYLVTSGFLAPLVAGTYALAWALIFVRVGVPRALGMLVQAPVYGAFWLAAFYTDAVAGWWIAAWAGAAIVVTWPHFPNVMVRGFFAEMHKFLHERRASDGEEHHQPG